MVITVYYYNIIIHDKMKRSIVRNCYLLDNLHTISYTARDSFANRCRYMSHASARESDHNFLPFMFIDSKLILKVATLSRCSQRNN